MKLSISSIATLATLSGALLLSACNTSALLKKQYPDREIFYMEDEDGDTFSYLCDKKTSDSETDQNVEAAHTYVLQRMDEISSNTIGKVLRDEIESDEPTSKIGFMGSYMSQSMKMNNQLKTVFEETNAKFNCLLVDIAE